jgi:hypothetical protein
MKQERMQIKKTQNEKEKELKLWVDQDGVQIHGQLIVVRK